MRRVLISAVLLALFYPATAIRAESPSGTSPIGKKAGLTNFIKSYAAAHDFSGTIVVEEDGKPLYRGAFGLADRPFNIPCTLETKFKIASVTKVFTSVLTLQLAEERKVELDASIKNYLPNFPGEGADTITIRNLLNHTSGLPNADAALKSVEYALANGMPWYQLPATLDDLIARFYSGKLLHKPGEKFGYNNADYIVLGKIIESITGKSYEEVLRERILSPLGMRETGMAHQSEIVPRLAPSYFTVNKQLINDMPAYPENWYAAGGMYSTADDLMRLNRALYDGKLLKPASLDLMLTPGLDHYGFGVWIGNQNFGGKSYRNVNRPGSIMGANASFYHFNGLGFSKTINIVILSNTDRTSMDKFSFEIGKSLLN